jgi:hypothetical protein
MNADQRDTLTPEQGNITQFLLERLDQLPHEFYTVRGRASYGNTEYTPMEISPEELEASMGELKMLIQFASNRFAGQLAPHDMPKIISFEADNKQVPYRIQLRANKGEFAYFAIVSYDDTSGTFVSLERSKIGLTGIGRKGPTHKPGEYLDFVITQVEDE